mmetsp:Transcript_7001/g.25325  ORF Transcript_7001/g.25325 Transcript_7001/m.25325 type:complete len:220 (+) Transcript_7001:314-973(+)
MSRCPPSPAALQVVSSIGQPWDLAHLRISRYPPKDAPPQVLESHSHPSLLSHWRTWRCPPMAALMQVPAFIPIPSPAHHLRISRWPHLAATSHTMGSIAHPSRLSHWSVPRWPLHAARDVLRLSNGHGGISDLMYSSTLVWPPSAAASAVDSSQGHPMRLRYLRVSTCPSAAATSVISRLRGQGQPPSSLAHFSTRRCPFSAALRHVVESQGHPFFLSH